MPVYGMMQLLVYLLQAVVKGPAFPFGQCAAAAAAGGILPDVPFQRRAAKQVGMEEYSRITVCAQTIYGRHFKRVSGIGKPNEGTPPVRSLVADERIKVTGQPERFGEPVIR